MVMDFDALKPVYIVVKKGGLSSNQDWQTCSASPPMSRSDPTTMKLFGWTKIHLMTLRRAIESYKTATRHLVRRASVLWPHWPLAFALIFTGAINISIML